MIQSNQYNHLTAKARDTLSLPAKILINKNLFVGDVLDFGCGSKPYKSLFYKAKSYIGLDIETSGHHHGNSKVDVFYDGKIIPFEDNRFDAVVSFEVFEHVFNPTEVLREIRRVLKPGGQLLITVPFAWDEHEAPCDFARYTSYGVRHLFESNGFAVIEIRKTTAYFLAVMQMLIAYVVQHLAPKGRWLSKIFQLAVVFPLTGTALLLNRFLPRRDQYFSNTVTLGLRTK